MSNDSPNGFTREFIRDLCYLCECQMATLEELKGLSRTSTTRVRRQSRIVEKSIQLLDHLGIERAKIAELLDGRCPRLKKELGKTPLQRLAEL